MKRLFIWIAVAGLLLGPTAAALAQNTLTVENIAADRGTSGAVVQIRLTNTETLGGLEFTLIEPSPLLTPTAIRLGPDVNADFQTDGTTKPDSVKILFVSFSGDSLTAGDRIIAEVLYDVDSTAAAGTKVTMTIEDVVGADPNAGALQGTSVAGVFTITAAPTILSGDPPDAEENTLYIFEVAAEDEDGDALTYALAQAPAWLKIDADDGVLSGLPEITGSTAEEITFAVTATETKAGGSAVSATYTITVSPDGTAPEFTQRPAVQEITDKSAAILWASNEAAGGKVKYGVVDAASPTAIRLKPAGAAAFTDSTNTVSATTGRVDLAGLTASTEYEAEVTITDSRGNAATDGPILFTTLAAPDSLPPAFTKLPFLVSRTDSALTFGWEADEAARAILRLVRTDSDSLDPNIVDSTGVFSRTGELTIRGLTPGTNYIGELTLVDAQGNRPFDQTTQAVNTNPARVEGRTADAPDAGAPFLISAVDINTTNTTADLFYKTNEAASTTIQYGLSRALGLTFTDAAFVTDHQVRLTGLKASTTYFFQISGADPSGNAMTPTAVDSFRTDQNPDTSGPIFTSGPSLIAISDVSAVLRWANDEPAFFDLKAAATGSADTLRLSGSNPALTRNVSLSGLKANTDYTFFIIARDGAGNRSVVKTGTFRTKGAVDTTPPRLIGSVNVTARGSDRFRVEWNTDEASDTQGIVGTARTDTSVVQKDFVNDATPTTKHAALFTNLTPGTRYFFRVFSLDANGNRFTSGIDSVRTLAAPDVTPPSITSITASAGETRALIEWDTASEPSNSRVVFGTDSSAVAQGNTAVTDVVTDAELIKKHKIVLTGLTAGTKYFYRVQSTDASGNKSAALPAIPKTFATRAAADTVGPAITSINVSTTATTAQITWLTDEPANSAVLFDTLSATATSTPTGLVEDPDPTTSHAVTLTNLTPGKTYRFRVRSADQTGNATVRPSTARSGRLFTTSSVTVDNQPPLLISRPARRYVTSTKVIITWTTDEPADDRVFFKETTASLFQEQSGVSGLRTDHKVILDGLSASTRYNFVISSKDASGNELRFPSTAVVLKTASGLYKITGIAQAATGSFTTNQGPDTQAPVILSGPVVTGTNTDQVTLNWTTDELSTSTVNFGTGGNTDQKVEDGTLVTSHTVTITGLSASTVYTYAVSSIDPSNNGPSTSGQAVVQTSAQADVTPPVISNISTSSTFVSSADGASATITWTTNESSDSKVEYGTTAALGQIKSQSEAVTSHSVTITRLTPSTTYSFRVASTDGSGNGPSTSTIATFTTAGATTDNSAPTFSDVNTGATTDTKVEVSWNTNENASSILLVINAAGDTSRVESGTLTKTHSLAVTDANFISANTTYTVVVQGEDGAGNLGTGSATSVTTSAGPDVTPPSAPGNLTAQAGNAEVQLNWDAVTATDLAGYNVFKDGGQIASNVTGISFTSTGLTNGTAVNFEVKAVDQTGNVSTSNPTVSATPALTAAPSAPASLGTFEGGTEVTTVSLKPILVISNATPVSGRATPTYTFAVYSDAGLTNLVTSISGITQGTSTNPTHWQVADPTLTDGIVLLDGETYHWRARANDGVTDGPWSSTKTFTTSASKPTAVELAGFTAETDRGIVDIRWQTYSNLGLRGFHVYRSVNPGGPFELISGDDLIAADRQDYVFSDRDVTVNVTYYYQVQAINQDEAPQTFGPIVVKVSPPNTFTLGQNAPNPFNPTTSIRYELPVSGQVQLLVYNLLGQEVVTLVDERRQAGFHTVTWNGLNAASQSVASGVYFYRIVVNGDDSNTFSTSKKMLLLK